MRGSGRPAHPELPSDRQVLQEGASSVPTKGKWGGGRPAAPTASLLPRRSESCLLTKRVASSVSDGGTQHRVCALHQCWPASPAYLLLVNGRVFPVLWATKCRVNGSHTHDPWRSGHHPQTSDLELDQQPAGTSWVSLAVAVSGSRNDVGRVFSELCNQGRRGWASDGSPGALRSEPRAVTCL